MPIELFIKGILVGKLDGIARKLLPELIAHLVFRCFKEGLHEGFLLLRSFAQLFDVHFEIHRFAIEAQRLLLLVELFDRLLTLRHEVQVQREVLLV